jgi:hypothetical protein
MKSDSHTSYVDMPGHQSTATFAQKHAMSPAAPPYGASDTGTFSRSTNAVVDCVKGILLLRARRLVFELMTNGETMPPSSVRVTLFDVRDPPLHYFGVT